MLRSKPLEVFETYDEGMTAPSIAILGAGSMGGAILRGVVASGLPTRSLIVTNRTPQKAAELTGLAGVTSVALADNPRGNHDAVADADIVLIGVKPVMVADLLRDIASSLKPGAIVVSLAAGTTLATMAAAAGEGVKIVRAMPNTPAIVRKAVTGLAANAQCTPADIAAVSAVFEAVGTVIKTDEDGIDRLSTISGSGPAYVYLLIEQLTQAALHQGFALKDARVMAEQTFIGAAALLDATGDDPAELRRRVTSPKGTTEQAIFVMQDAGLDAMFITATNAALARARELAAGA